MQVKKIWDKLVKNMGIPKLILVMAAGIVLVFLSAADFMGGNKNDGKIKKNETVTDNSSKNTKTDDKSEYTELLEKQLEETLAKVSGVGKVKVMITLEASSEKVTLSDPSYSSDSISENDASGGTRNEQSTKSEPETVFEENDNKKSPYVVKELEPKIKGVAVVAQGGDNITVKKEIIEAVMVLFGLESHKIKVMKLE